VKELYNFGCVQPEKFVAGCIITKLPQTWTYFATSLTHKRQEFGIADLIGSLDVEEKARAKDVRGKKIVEANSSAHVVQKGPQNSHKKIFKQEIKQKNTTPFKKKKNQQNKGKEKCYTCGVEGHYAAECEKSMYKPKKSANMIEADGGTSGYGNLLPTVL